MLSKIDAFSPQHKNVVRIDLHRIRTQTHAYAHAFEHVYKQFHLRA